MFLAIFPYRLNDLYSLSRVASKAMDRTIIQPWVVLGSGVAVSKAFLYYAHTTDGISTMGGAMSAFYFMALSLALVIFSFGGTLMMYYYLEDRLTWQGQLDFRLGEYCATDSEAHRRIVRAQQARVLTIEEFAAWWEKECAVA